jgi:2-dehydro-3-deoxygluconokinase
MAEFSSYGAERYGLSFSGDAVNVATSAARLGLKSCVISAAGDDYFGMELLKFMKLQGISLDGMKTVKGGFTGIYFISLGKNGEHEFTYFRKGSAAADVHLTERQLRAIGNSSMFHFSGIAQGISGTSARAVAIALKTAKKAGCFISYDVNFRPALWKKDEAIRSLETVAGNTDVVFISSEDYAMLFGKESVSAAIKHIRSMGAVNVVYKSGGKGSTADFNGNRIRQEVFHVNALDATGAGDAFDAGFLSQYYRTGNTKESLMFASVNAALKCLKKGGTRGLPKLDIVMKTMEKQRRKKSGPEETRPRGWVAPVNHDKMRVHP